MQLPRLFNWLLTFGPGDLQGVFLKPRFTRGTHTFDFPILLTNDYTNWRVVAGAYIVPPARHLCDEAPHHQTPAALAQAQAGAGGLFLAYCDTEMGRTGLQNGTELQIPGLTCSEDRVASK